MKRIVNLTQHPVTPEQAAAGVVDVEDRQRLCEFLTFAEPPTVSGIHNRAESIVTLITGRIHYAMIGGAPYLMSALEKCLLRHEIHPLYSFSQRISQERILADGTVEKSSVFKHSGFVSVIPFAPPLEANWG